ncbi:hypothetical protein BpHYR1_034648 [Brachionus plicatilis]
MLAQD